MTEDLSRPEPTPDLSGRVALVTGGGRGIGRSIAVQLAGCGASVIVLARSEGEIEETVSLIRRRGGEASAFQADLSRTGQLRELAAKADATHGPIDLLVNNAGTVSPLGPTMDLSMYDVQTAFAVNVHAVIALSTAVLPGMLARRWGRIVNVSSGVVGRPETMVGGNVYAATKSALETHTVNLAAEVEGTGVTVNAYRPGTVDTDMQGFIRRQDPERVRGGLVERFQRMQHDGSLITPETSARSLVARLARTETGTIWSAPTREQAVALP